MPEEAAEIVKTKRCGEFTTDELRESVADKVSLRGLNIAPLSPPHRPPAPPEQKMGFIYFARAGRTNNVKIGFATRPEDRVRDLQCASPHPMHLIGHLPGSMRDEYTWHERFAAERVRGEWFTLSQRLRSAINALATMNCGYVSYLHLSLLSRNAAPNG